MSRRRLGDVGLVLLASVVALLLAALVAGVVLAATGADPLRIASETLGYGTSPRSVVAVIDRSISYYLAGIAAAIGFRMLLFNIGIDGQYRLAAFVAAAVGGAVVLPWPFTALLVIGVAMLVGGAWAAIAGLLAAYRGVSVVISTIPSFVMGFALVYVFAVRLDWFPTGGWGGPRHLVLPVVAFGLSAAGGVYSSRARAGYSSRSDHDPSRLAPDHPAADLGASSRYPDRRVRRGRPELYRHGRAPAAAKLGADAGGSGHVLAVCAAYGLVSILDDHPVGARLPGNRGRPAHSA